MEVCKSDMISCAIEWQPSEAAFDVWPLMTERASQGKRPYSVPAMPDEMMLSYTLMGLSARSTLRSYKFVRVSRDGHTRPHGVVFRAICLAPIDASGVLGRLPAKSGELEPSAPNRFELPESIILCHLLVKAVIASLSRVNFKLRNSGGHLRATFQGRR